MTGAYFRVKRGDSWEAIEIEHLTKEERHERFIKRTPKALVAWIEMLCETVRENQELIDGLVADGILIQEGKKTE